ncbi:pyrroline-5-carboxylate reductase [uncultured Polaribacter sp.]|uniref:pyrroline-5-carboxylate reductase n=1 Tax=uncultured Polaribacter sp. TaxID=174711 RepID=UPI0026041C78|nr:pyrroline-5-carboxylate reductase [uncultured Polaribacter sp.]
MKIAIIGTGNLGSAIAKGLIKNKAFTSLYLSDKNTHQVDVYKDTKNVTITNNNSLAIEAAEVVIFALQPKIIATVIEELSSIITENHIVMSVAAGFEISAIERIVGTNKSVIRVMPNTAISIGKSMTCLSGNANGEAKMEVAKTIFNELGTTLEIPESQMQAATVICSSGIAFWMRLVRATTQGAIQLGFEAEEADKIALQTCLGAASLLQETDNHIEAEIDRVTTPGGCTIEGLNAMEAKGMSTALVQGITASFEKLNQLKKN